MSWKPIYNLTFGKKPAGVVLSDGENAFVAEATDREGKPTDSGLSKFFAKSGKFTTYFDEVFAIKIVNKETKEAKTLVFRPAGTASNGSPRFVAAPDEFGNFLPEPVFMFPVAPKASKASEGEDWG